MFELIRNDANIVLPYLNKLNVSVLHAMEYSKVKALFLVTSINHSLSSLYAEKSFFSKGNKMHQQKILGATEKMIIQSTDSNAHPK